MPTKTSVAVVVVVVVATVVTVPTATTSGEVTAGGLKTAFAVEK